VKYLSTRGHAARPEFCDILLGGLAPDGGLYLPESYPQISRAELDAWRGLSYADLAFAILSKFITDIPAADLKHICSKTYTADVYCFARPGDNPADITPVHWLEEGRVGLRPLRLRDARAWREVRLRNADWLSRWEATSPVPSGDASSTTTTSTRSGRASTRASSASALKSSHLGTLRAGPSRKVLNSSTSRPCEQKKRTAKVHSAPASMLCFCELLPVRRGTLSN